MIVVKILCEVKGQYKLLYLKLIVDLLLELLLNFLSLVLTVPKCALNATINIGTKIIRSFSPKEAVFKQ